MVKKFSSHDEEMSTSTYANGIVFFSGDDYGDRNCYSAVGLAPGFRGQSTLTMAEYGAPSGWQGISLSERCGGCSKFQVHHEVGHALGRFHEFRRPDRDNHLIVSPAAVQRRRFLELEYFLGVIRNTLR